MKNTLIITLLLCGFLSACTVSNVNYSNAVNNYISTLEGVGLPREKGATRLDPDLWQGMSREEVLALLSSMDDANEGLKKWPSAKKLVGSALSAPLNVSFLSDGHADFAQEDNLLTARINALNSIGLHDKGTQLYEAAYKKFPDEVLNNPSLVKAGVSAMIGAGQGPLACIEAASLRSNDNIFNYDEAFWNSIDKRCDADSLNPLPFREAKQAKIAPVSENPKLSHILREFSKAHANGQELPYDWVVALSEMEVPKTKKAARKYAVLQTIVLIGAPIDYSDEITAKIAKALKGDSYGKKVFKDSTAYIFSALSLSVSNINDVYDKDFLLTDVEIYVIPDDVASQNLKVALDRQVSGEVSLVVARTLAEHEPSDINPATLYQCLHSLVEMGIANSADGIAITALLNKAQNL